MKKVGNDLRIVGGGKPACGHASAHPIQERHNFRCVEGRLAGSFLKRAGEQGGPTAISRSAKLTLALTASPGYWGVGGGSCGLQGIGHTLRSFRSAKFCQKMRGYGAFCAGIGWP